MLQEHAVKQNSNHWSPDIVH